MPCPAGSGIDGPLLAIHYSLWIGLPTLPVLSIYAASGKFSPHFGYVPDP